MSWLAIAGYVVGGLGLMFFSWAAGVVMATHEHTKEKKRRGWE